MIGAPIAWIIGFILGLILAVIGVKLDSEMSKN